MQSSALRPAAGLPSHPARQGSTLAQFSVHARAGSQAQAAAGRPVRCLRLHGCAPVRRRAWPCTPPAPPPCCAAAHLRRRCWAAAPTCAPQPQGASPSASCRLTGRSRCACPRSAEAAARTRRQAAGSSALAQE
eukprot:358490-Chlamydomonas_euryale.AAC.4